MFIPRACPVLPQFVRKTRLYTEQRPTGKFVAECDVWYIDGRGEDECYCLTLGEFDTQAAAEAFILGQPDA